MLTTHRQSPANYIVSDKTYPAAGYEDRKPKDGGCDGQGSNSHRWLAAAQGCIKVFAAMLKCDVANCQYKQCDLEEESWILCILHRLH